MKAFAEILMTDVGVFPCPPELSVSGLKLRADRNPDRRTSAGRDWHARFRSFCEAKVAEYMAAADTPARN